MPAQITTLTNIAPITGADFIVSAGVWNGVAEIARVVVNKKEVEGSLGIYFAPDLQLSEQYCAANDLIARFDDQGKKIGGGYFDHRRRVISQKFKKVRSDGLWMPIESLKPFYAKETDFVKFAQSAEVGVEFDTVKDGFKDYKICEKYLTPQTLKAMRRGMPALPKVDFPRHIDTAQLIHSIGQIPTGATLYISRKLHGTSHRKGNVLTEQKRNWWQKLAHRVARLFNIGIYMPHAFEIVHGTRNVVIHAGKVGFHGSEDFRYAATAAKDLHPNEMVYGEIVGYANGAQIMPSHSTKDLKDVRAVYGDTITYTYGCEPNTCKFYVYRITQKRNGYWQDLPYNEMVIRCAELGYDYIPAEWVVTYDGNAQKLMDMVTHIAEAEGTFTRSTYGNHIEEGVVIRVEHEGSVTFMKYKSFAFKVMEGIAKLDDSYTDLEETS